MRALSAHGRLLGSRFVVPDPENLIGTDHLGWVTTSGFEPLDYTDRSGPPHQIVGASLDGSRVVWVETTSTEVAAADWRIYAAELERPGRTLVADSDTVYGKEPLGAPIGETLPVILGSKAYWGAVPAGRDPVHSRILYDDLDGSAARPKTLRGSLPASNGRRLFLVRQHLADPSKEEVQIISRTRAGAEKVVQRFRLPAGRWVTALAASATHLAWVVGESEGTESVLYVQDLATARVTGILMHHGGADTMALGVGRNRVAWGNGSANEGEDAGEYVFRPRTEALVRLGEEVGHSVAFANGDWIAWVPRLKQRGQSWTNETWVSH